MRYTIDDRAETFEHCVMWARLYLEEQYHNQISQLLYNFSPAQVTSTGAPFWSGPKCCPKPHNFDLKNPMQLDYVVAAANLRAFICVQVPEFIPKYEVRIAVTDSEAQENNAINDMDRLSQLQKELPSSEELKNLKIQIVAFEKDDD
ncbi:ubiquitin-like modifier-activating enzyme 1 [Trichonephila clavata]|uniref:Ubiquitin-like modifier-activating enzyme 1 n=1 Tax=Trichonephila clavata TaxID=2740835 RepID=A0A8X6H0W1_TRICU|nr:ubiquitin-like modifier-activating enzyme 1 [Trichonephila clavata]